MVEHRLVPRWRDADALGHVNHAVFLTYFEDARDRWLMKAGITGVNYLVAHCTVDFEGEIPLKEEIVIRCRAKKLGRKSITTEEEIFNLEGKRLASASFVLVMWDAERRESRLLTQLERESLMGQPSG